MIVSELIELLQCEDQNAQIKIAHYQQGWGWHVLSNPSICTLFSDQDLETGHDAETDERSFQVVALT